MEYNKAEGFVNKIPAGIGIFAIKGTEIEMLYMNDAYYHILGVSREERKQYMGKNALKVICPEDIPLLYAGIAKLKGGSPEERVNYRIKNSEGNWHWINLTASVLENREDYLELCCVFVDCDKMIRTQKELEDNRTRLKMAMDIADVMDWRYDFVTHTVTDSGSLGEKYHWPKVIPHADRVVKEFILKDRVHPDSAKDIMWLYNHCPDKKTISRDVKYKSSSGEGYIWLRIIYTPIFNEDGSCTEVLGTSYNITETKEREQAYKELLRLHKMASKNIKGLGVGNLTDNCVVESDCFLPNLYSNRDISTVDSILTNIVEDVGAEDRAKFLPVSSVEALLENFKNGSTHFEFTHHLNSNPGYYLSTFDLVRNPYTGKVECLITLEDITNEERSKLIVQRLLAIDYQSILTIDSATGQAEAFHSTEVDPILARFISLFDKHKDAKVAKREFFELYAVEEDRENAIRENDYVYIAEQLEKQPVFETMYALKINGKVLHDRALYTYLDKDRRYILCAVQDISTTYEREELQKKKLEEALEAAKLANASKTDFLSRMSHDIRTPLNAILGMTYLAKDELYNSKAVEGYLDTITSSGHFLLGLINDILDINKIESGNLDFHLEPCEVEDFVADVESNIRPLMDKKHITFNINMGCGHGCILSDRLRLNQIFFNLLSNAAKYTPEGGKVDFYAEPLEAPAGMAGFRCVVEDNGVGISQEYLPHLFQPFTRDRSAVINTTEGSGLGLAIVKNIVDAMGGSVKVESKLGVGTKFIVDLVLPIAEPSKNKNLGGTLTEDILRDKEILLVEDNAINTKIATKLLEKKGCKVTVAANGKIAIELFEQSPLKAFDAILMDVRMPVMDGFTATKIIRSLARPDAKTIPIIAMTANAYAEDVQKTLDAGMNAHLAKPIDIKNLYGTLIRYLS